MPMFVEIFLMLCIIAQHEVCSTVPQPVDVIPTKNATVGHNSTILSLIKIAGSCNAFKNLESEQLKFQQLEEYCGRPFPDKPRVNGFVSYEIVLCMVLYDAAQHVCKAGHQESTKDIQNVSGNFSCDTMIKQVHDAFDNTEQWVALFEAKLGNITDCKLACIQDKTISPLCEYIWKANTLRYQAQMSSSISADMSPIENPQVNPKGHGKTNKEITNKNKPLEVKTSDQPSSADLDLSILNSGSQNTEQVDHKMIPTYKSAGNKDADLAEINGNSTQPGSANDVKNNVKEEAHTTDGNERNDFTKQAQATVNTRHNDDKKPTHTTDSNTQSNIKKHAHGTNSSEQNIIKKPEHATNNNNHPDEVTSHDGTVSPSVMYDGSTGMSISSDSKSNTALQPESKSPAGVYASGTEMENQIGGNEDLVMSTYENTDKDEDKGMAESIPNVDDDQEEDERNLENQEEQSNEKPKHTETTQKEAETVSTIQLNQLGDAADSHFYAYFMTMVVICIIGYLVFHNKQKILALALEGRSRRGTRRRPNTSAYRKLDSNLEEAVTSTGSTSVTHVIY